MPTAEEIAARIDRDRRQEERELLALLLLLFGETYLHVRSALRVGADPYAAATNVILGNPTLGLPGLPDRLAPALLRASYSGWRRTVLMVPGDMGRPPNPADVPDEYGTLYRQLGSLGYTPTVDYRSRAQQAAGQMLGTLLRRVREGIAGGLSGVKASFETWGYRARGPHGAWSLEAAAERMGVEAYETGYMQGWARVESRQSLRGFRYVATLDERTSDICNTYHGVKLPPWHDWLRTHHPPNHWHCRSVLVPLFGDFTATPESDLPYSPPPEPGFGEVTLFSPLLPYLRPTAA